MNNDSTNPGWKTKDHLFLNRNDNTHEPDIQIFDEGDFEEDNLVARNYFCVMCQAKGWTF